MRILYFTSSSNKSGGSRQALYLARGMEARGHSVAFFLPGSSSLPQLDPDWQGWRPLGPPATWKSALETALRASPGPAVIHAFHNAALKRLAWWSLFWKQRAVCFAQRGVLFWPRNPLPYWSPGIACFVVNTAACARVLRAIGLPSRRIRLVPNAIPKERVTPTLSRARIRAALGLAPEDLVFGAIADSSPVKGVPILLAAFAEAFKEKKGRTIHLLVKGIDKPLLRRDPLPERVRLLPRSDDVADFLLALDIFVLPSLSESMPNTLLEAICLGLPCIGSAVGAVPEMLASCGLLVPPGDVAALARAMRVLANDPALADRYAAAARIQAESYRLEKRLDQMETLYAEFLRPKENAGVSF